MGEVKYREIMYRDAIREALDEEMTRDENVILLGEDVGVIGGNFKTSVGLMEKYGEWRVKDTPISENSFVGLGVGAALAGLRPVVEIMFADFLGLSMDQIGNQAAKIRYMSGGQVRVPLTIRAPIGAGRSSAAQHSQSLHAWAAHVPGLIVALPSSGEEAKGLLKTAIRDDNPVVFFEHKMLYTEKFEVPEKEYVIPFGKANVVHEGDELTIVATSKMVLYAMNVAKELRKDGKRVEVIDLRTIVPLDKETIINSVKKTGKLLIIDEGHMSFGISGEIALSIMNDIFYFLDAPIMRIGTADVPLPFSPALEFPIIPDEKDIFTKVSEMLGY